MMRTSILFPTIAVALMLGACGARQPAASLQPRSLQVHALYLHGVDSLDSALVALERGLADLRLHQASAGRMRELFLAARRKYKRVEYLAEHYAPTTAAGLNGPPLIDVEEDDPNQVEIAPEGLQVMEAMLYADPVADPDTIAEQLSVIRANGRRLRMIIASTTLTDENIFEAMRLEIARIISLGISGFDAPAAGSGVAEAGAALGGIREVVNLYRVGDAAPSQSGQMLDSLLGLTIADLDRSHDFMTFDRVRFIREFANPIARALARFRQDLGVGFPPSANGPFRESAATLFDSSAFDPDGFAPPYAVDGNADRVELGRLLFFDPLLSGDGERSCASCHRPERGFSDGETLSVAFGLDGHVARNTPTLLNAALQNGAFYDRRVTYLEDQATEVLASRSEMHGSLDRAVGHLRASREYAALFARAFPRSEASPISDLNIRIATSSYIRSLVSLDAPFDRYLRGENVLIAPAVIRGFNLFMGKGRCGTCHFAPLYNGTVPPTFAESETEILGVTTAWPSDAPRIDPDAGRFAASRIEIDRFAFKTPSIRNVALTAPYMHNGAFGTLEDVIDFYDRGGALGLGLDLPTQTLAPDRLNLTSIEKSDLVEFLKALTDTTGISGRPAALPSLGSVQSVSRRIGGSY